MKINVIVYKLLYFVLLLQIQLSKSDLCIESEDDVTTKGSLLILQKCAPIKRQVK